MKDRIRKENNHFMTTPPHPTRPGLRASTVSPFAAVTSRRHRPGRALGLGLAALLAFGALTAGAQTPPTQSFGVIIHRNPTITAQYWNPILKHVSGRSGVPLELRVARTGAEHTEAVGRGEFRYLYSNHNFIGANDDVGYKVFARPREEAGRGIIVVPEASLVRSIEELRGSEVVFPHRAAFLGYHLPMDALLRRDIQVKVLFAGNQEGAIAQMVAGRALAAGVSAEVFRAYAKRNNIAFREIWRSEPYLNLALSRHPAVPEAQANAVRDAFIGMDRDPEGSKVLAAVSELVKSDIPLAFVAARDADFDNMRRFYKTTKVVLEQ
jgi:phosphonate transport system substrate-binding protein